MSFKMALIVVVWLFMTLLSLYYVLGSKEA